MRRSDRAVTDEAKIRRIIESCTCCRIGFSDQGAVYIVPMNFGYAYKNGVYTLYFHSAAEGRKISLLRSAPTVGFEMDTAFQLHGADTACGHSAAFRSIIGTGKAEIVTDTAEKQRGLRLLMQHMTGKTDWTFDEAKLQAVAVFRITVTELSCKEHA